MTAGGIDWAGAHERLESARRALERAAAPSAEEASRLLEQRARALAAPEPVDDAPAETVELLLFTIGGERRAVDACHVLEAVPPAGLTAVPCTPPWVLGAMLHRGSVLPVLELGPLAGTPPSAAGVVVAVRLGELTFGIAADALGGVVRHDVGALGHGEAGRIVPGTDGEPAVVLDLPSLAADGRLSVEDHVAWGPAAGGNGGMG